MSFHSRHSLLPVFIRIFTLAVLLYVCLFAPTAEPVMVYDASTGPSYAEDVRPIFVRRCAACHNAQKGLPNLLDYKTAYNLRKTIRERVGSLEMPYVGYLTPSERGTILQWTQGGKE